MQAKSVINCSPKKSEIILAIKKIYSKNFKQKVLKTVNPYGNGGAVQKTYKIIEKLKLKKVLKKKFFDLKN